MIRAALLGTIVAAGVIGATGSALAETTSLSSEELRWLDPRVSEQERAILDSIVGFAPPEFPADLEWVGAQPLALADLRGKVVVIQTWTRKTVLGRAAPSRAASVLKGYPSDDVQIIALHTPEGAEAVETYADRRDVGVPVVVDAKGAYCDELGAFERPVTIVLDRQGVVRYAGVSITGLPQAVEKLETEAFNAGAPSPTVVASRDSRDKALGADTSAGVAGPAARQGSGSFPPVQGRIANAADIRGRKGPEPFAQWLTAAPQTEGKVVVAEFWATWCGPCVRGIPHLNELQARFPNEVVVMGISDETVAKVQPAISRLNMKYTVGTDPSRRMRQMIQNQGIPHAIVMSPDGIVRWQGHPAQLSEDVLRQIVQASDIGASDSGHGSRNRWTGAEG